MGLSNNLEKLRYWLTLVISSVFIGLGILSCFSHLGFFGLKIVYDVPKEWFYIISAILTTNAVNSVTAVIKKQKDLKLAQLQKRRKYDLGELADPKYLRRPCVDCPYDLKDCVRMKDPSYPYPV